MKKTCFLFAFVLLCSLWLYSCFNVKPSMKTSQSSSDTLPIIFNTPDEVILYKNGNAYSVDNPQDVVKIMMVFSNWFPIDTIVSEASLIISDELINEIKTEQTSIELICKSGRMTNIGIFSDNTRLLVPVTGEYKNIVFKGVDNGYATDYNGGAVIANKDYKTDTSLFYVLESIVVK